MTSTHTQRIAKYRERLEDEAKRELRLAAEDERLVVLLCEFVGNGEHLSNYQQAVMSGMIEKMRGTATARHQRAADAREALARLGDRHSRDLATSIRYDVDPRDLTPPPPLTPGRTALNDPGLILMGADPYDKDDVFFGEK